MSSSGRKEGKGKVPRDYVCRGSRGLPCVEGFAVGGPGKNVLFFRGRFRMRAADGFSWFLPEFFRNRPAPVTVLDITCLGDRIQKTVSGMRRVVNSRMASAGVPEDGYGSRKNGFGDSPGERPSPNKSDFPASTRVS